MFRVRLASGADFSPAEILGQIHAWLNQALSPVSAATEALLFELRAIQEDLAAGDDFQALIHSALLPCGRGIKQRLQAEFAQPEVLTMVVNYNLVSRRTFEALLARAMRGLGELPADLREKEYRAASEEFRHWSGAAASSAAAPSRGPAAPAASQAAVPSQKDVIGALKKLGTDPQVEENQLRATTAELVSFAQTASEAVPEMPLANCALTLRPWEFYCLAVDYPVTEKSFRAEMNRVLRRTMGLLASILEQSTLYSVRRNSEFLWKKHLNSLIYLRHTGAGTLAELEKIAQDAAGRGLLRRAEELNDTAGRLRRDLQEIAELAAEPAGDAVA